MTNSTAWATRDPQNSSKSGARSTVLSPEELHGGKALFRRTRQPVDEREPIVRRFKRAPRDDSIAGDGATRAAACQSAAYTSHMTGDLAGLPGAEIIERGLADLAAGLPSIEALVVSIGAPKLRQLGLSVPQPLPDPEHQLYLRLAQADPDGAHSKYNALVRRLVSFEHALACVR